jgi:uncharacterized protein YqjF (DUF2071 family)
MSWNEVFLRAEWRNLAMLNYEIDPALLVRFIPAGTELDSWNGKVFVSLVGFCFLKTEVCRISIPFHRNFDEVNIRFYVRRKEGGEIRRGVVFVREIVPRWAIATIARKVYNESYVALPMNHQIKATDDSGLFVEYSWRSGIGWNRMSLYTAGRPALPRLGSEQQFITEHYWGYAVQRDGSTMEYHVAHPSWQVWNATGAKFEGDVAELYGEELAVILRTKPSSAFLAEGSGITVSRGKKI